MLNTTPRPFVALAVLMTTALAVSAPLRAEVVDRIVLRVNDRIATLYDYQNRRREFLRELDQQKMDPAEKQKYFAESGEQVFRSMLEELLILARADQLQVKVSDSELDQALDQTRKNMGIDTRDEFMAAVKQSGLDWDRFRERWRLNLTMQDVIGRDVRSKIEVTEEDLRKAYKADPEAYRVPERLHLEEIVVLDTSDLSHEDRLALARSLRDEIAGGRGLEEVVKEYAGKNELSDVLDLGWVGPGELAADLEKAVWDLPVGSVSAAVESRGGVHILKVLERKEAGVKPFAEVQEEMRNREFNKRFDEALEKYLADLEKSSYVKADPPPEAAGYATLGSDVADPLKEEVGGEAPPGEASPGEEPAAAPPASAPSTSPPTKPPAKPPAGGR